MNDSHTLLVVDDEPDVVKSVQDLLRLDYRVLGATRPRDGIDILSRHTVHVIMTDQRMPEMSGVELLAQVRQQYPETVRLLFTGYADMRAVIDAINLGSVFRYITKPWDPDELQVTVRQACERYDLVHERKRLLRELQEKNQELERANTELRQANELKHAFIQVASHELRTPLAILLGLSHLALRTADLSPSLRDWLERIDQAARKLQRLVDQIVTMLSAQQFERTLNRQRHDLGRVLRKAADDVRPFVELRGQDLRVDLADDLGEADIDSEKIEDSVNHLLLNAIKFTPDGGTITLAARRNADAVIRVSDTGRGIPADELPRLFQPFFTGLDVSRHSSGHHEYGRQGIGLGLAVVKAFIDMHGGSVTVQSEPGHGTTFTITLPAAGSAS